VNVGGEGVGENRVLTALSEELFVHNAWACVRVGVRRAGVREIGAAGVGPL
jgi:hypothetical protein